MVTNEGLEEATFVEDSDLEDTETSIDDFGQGRAFDLPEVDEDKHKLTAKDTMHMNLYDVNANDVMTADFQFALTDDIQYPAFFATVENTLNRHSLVMFTANRDIAEGDYFFYVINDGKVYAMGKLDFTTDMIYLAKRTLAISKLAIKESAEQPPKVVTESDILRKLVLLTDHSTRVSLTPPEGMTAEEVEEAIEAQKKRNAIAVVGDDHASKETIAWINNNL